MAVSRSARISERLDTIQTQLRMGRKVELQPDEWFRIRLRKDGVRILHVQVGLGYAEIALDSPAKQ